MSTYYCLENLQNNFLSFRNLNTNCDKNSVFQYSFLNLTMKYMDNNLFLQIRAIGTFSNPVNIFSIDYIMNNTFTKSSLIEGQQRREYSIGGFIKNENTEYQIDLRVRNSLRDDTLYNIVFAHKDYSNKIVSCMKVDIKTGKISNSNLSSDLFKLPIQYIFNNTNNTSLEKENKKEMKYNFFLIGEKSDRIIFSAGEASEFSSFTFLMYKNKTCVSRAEINNKPITFQIQVEKEINIYRTYNLITLKDEKCPFGIRFQIRNINKIGNYQSFIKYDNEEFYKKIIITSSQFSRILFFNLTTYRDPIDLDGFIHTKTSYEYLKQNLLSNKIQLNYVKSVAGQFSYIMFIPIDKQRNNYRSCSLETGSIYRNYIAEYNNLYIELSKRITITIILPNNLSKLNIPIHTSTLLLTSSLKYDNYFYLSFNITAAAEYIAEIQVNGFYYYFFIKNSPGECDINNIKMILLENFNNNTFLKSYPIKLSLRCNDSFKNEVNLKNIVNVRVAFKNPSSYQFPSYDVHYYMNNIYVISIYNEGLYDIVLSDQVYDYDIKSFSVNVSQKICNEENNFLCSHKPICVKEPYECLEGEDKRCYMNDSSKPFYCESTKTCMKSQSDCRVDPSLLLCKDLTNMIWVKNLNQCPFILREDCSRILYKNIRLKDMCPEGNCLSDKSNCASRRVCPYRKVLCPNLTCRDNFEECFSQLPKPCGENLITCSDLSCSNKNVNCPSMITCKNKLHVVCPDGSCVDQEYKCKVLPLCSNESPYLCSNNKCVKNKESCTNNTSCGHGRLLYEKEINCRSENGE